MKKADAQNQLEPSPRSYRAMHALAHPFTKWARMSCREIYHLSAERMDRPLTRSENIRWRFHTLVCSLCRPLPKQFDQLRKLMSEIEEIDHAAEKSDVPKLSSAEIEDIVKFLRDSLSARKK